LILIEGHWSQVKPAFLAIAMFRWDITVALARIVSQIRDELLA